MTSLLYVGPLPPAPGGIAQHGANLVRGLRECGARVAAISWASQYPKLLYPGSRRSPDGDVFPGAQDRLRWWDPTGWHHVGRLARSADAIVVPWVTPVQFGPVGTLLRAAEPALRVVVAHNPLPHEPGPLDLPLSRWALAPADLALVHAHHIVGDLERLSPGIEVVVSPHPPNLPIQPHPLPDPQPLRLLFMGYVRPYKGLDLAIDAVQLLRRQGRDVVLTVAGEFWEPVSRWREYVRARGLEQHIELRAGYVPDSQLEGLLADHHLVVAPYRSATQSGIVPLALAAGRPVVVTDVGGLREAVRDGANGVVVPPDDVVALAAGVERGELLLGHALRGTATWASVGQAVLDGMAALRWR